MGGIASSGATARSTGMRTMNVAPSAGWLITRDVAAVCLGDRGDDGEPEPGALLGIGSVVGAHPAPRGIRAVEGFEDVCGLVGGEARPPVAHLDLGPAVLRPDVHGDRRARRCMRQRVRQQVREHLTQPSLVAHHRQLVGCLQLDRPRWIDRPGVVDRVGGHVRKVDRLVRDRAPLARARQEQAGPPRARPSVRPLARCDAWRAPCPRGRSRLLGGTAPRSRGSR